MNDDFILEGGKIKQIIFFATPYAFLCATLYLYSFWSSFNINFLEYISIADILKIAICPIVGALLAFLVGLLYSMYVDEVLKKPRKSKSKGDIRFWRICLLILAIIYIHLHFENIFFAVSVFIGLVLTNKS